MNNNETLVALPDNYIKRVDQIINEYNSTGRGLIHGFQKDAIQNAVGARQTNSWHKWRCDINLITTNKGMFLCVEDSGTAGLTGPNLPISEISRMCEADESFPEEWRLARISCNHVSGNLSTGAGLFGIGKTLYSAASEEKVCKYFFESVSNGYGYRCNVNDRNKSKPNGAVEGQEGKDFIRNNTGLEPINHIGTRIIICEPKKEIVDAILNGEMKKNIQETWWRIIPFHSEKDNGIFLNGEKITTPEQYLPSNYDNNHYYESDVSTLAFADLNLRTKKVGFFICKNLDEDLRGFYFYRRGMKIGQINLGDIVPKSLSDKYFGYIEVQPQWENELVPLENITHYDVQVTKKNNKIYSELRRYVCNLVLEKLKDWGFIKDKESQDRIVHSWFAEMQENIQNLFKNKGFDNLGKGDLKPQYSVIWKDFVYPNPDERKTVYDGDRLEFSYKIKSNFIVKKKFFVDAKIVSPNGFSKTLFIKEVEIEPQQTFISEKVCIDINQYNAEKYIDNAVVLKVTPETGRAISPKKQVFYYAIETKKMPEKDFDLIMSNRLMPKTSDKRVNSGQAIRDIVYSCTNNLEVPASVRLTVSTHNLENNAAMIQKVWKEEFVLQPFEERDSTPFDIVFDESTYSDILKKGKIDIRARLTINEDNGVYEKGEVVKEYKFTVYYNMNEKRGMEDSFTLHAAIQPDNPKRSWSVGHIGDWKIFVNIGHPEYVNYETDECKRLFIEKQIIQEFVILYLKEGKFDQIGFKDDPDGSNTDHLEILLSMNKTVDEMWWEICQRNS